MIKYNALKKMEKGYYEIMWCQKNSKSKQKMIK